MQLNPIVILQFILGVSILVMLSPSGSVLAGYTLTLLLVLSALNKQNIRSIFKRIKPYLTFIPIVGLIYFGMSDWLTNDSYKEIFYNAVFSIGKLLVLVSIMSVYLEQSSKNDIMEAFRSLWVKTRLPWKRVDNMFLFVELILRFFPAIQHEWNSILRSRRALGLSTGKTKWESARYMIVHLPGVIIQNYRKAEETANVMMMRGYGKQIPRGMAFPVNFTLRDGSLMMIVTVFLFGVHSIASI